MKKHSVIGERKSVRIVNPRQSVSQLTTISSQSTSNQNQNLRMSVTGPRNFSIQSQENTPMHQQSARTSYSYNPLMSKEEQFLKKRLSSTAKNQVQSSTQFIKNKINKEFPNYFSVKPTSILKKSNTLQTFKHQQHLETQKQNFFSVNHPIQEQEDSQKTILPTFSSSSLNKCIRKIKEVPKEKIINIDKSQMKNRKFRESSYNVHKNVQIGINKILRPEMRGVTDLKRMMKSLPEDRIDKILKKLSILKEDNDAELKVNVNTELVYDKLMLEKLKKKEKLYNINTTQKLLNQYKKDQIHKITCFSIPIPRENQQIFQMNNNTLKQLNKNNGEGDEDEYKQQQQNKKKAENRKNIYQKLYTSEQKKIFDKAKKNDSTYITQQQVLEHDPVYNQEEVRQIIQKSILLNHKKKKKNTNNNNEEENNEESSDDDSDSSWYRKTRYNNNNHDILNSFSSNSDHNITNKYDI